MTRQNAFPKVPDIRTSLPGPRSRAVIDSDEQYTSPSYTRVYPLAVKRGLGAVIEDLDAQVEEAATSLGASRWLVLTRVILPYLYPAWLTGFALSFARAIGEYGSVVFISGNMPMRTEIAPLLIITKLQQYDYAGATAIALVMLSISFVLLLAINALQHWTSRRLAH